MNFTFDTGFVNFFRGVATLGNEDRGNLLEHLALAELQAIFLRNEIFYWRDKQRHEVDFVLKKSRGRNFTTLECKRKVAAFDASRGLKSFRARYLEGKNILVTLDQTEPETQVMGGMEMIVTGLEHLSMVLR
jgi:predicted AAA+ superfamily ATPase